MSVLTRRQAVAASAAGLAAMFGSSALAQAMPELKLLVPAAPGGGWDQTARTIQSVLTGQQMVRSVQVTNVPSAGGMNGLAQFVNGFKGDPTGLLVSGFVMVGAILMNKSPVTLGDVTPIARLTGEWQALVVAQNSPIKSVADLVNAIKADVTKVSWGGGSAGGVDHITAAAFASKAGADGSKVNYIAHSGGGEALAAIISGRVTVGVSGIGEFEQHVKGRRLRWIGIAAPKGTAGLPGATLADADFDLVVQNWRGVFGGPDLSDAQRASLTKVVSDMAKSEAWANQLAQKGWENTYLDGQAFATFLADEVKRVDAVLRQVGLVRT
ncbi:Bug family tripartite tricarboxylate transporter substrate binding protein [Phreatobacter sp. AB_2022a]|uniref:Bug family tripartite tricarboxylate transporter substrate binding protein n=1 Tax=Phreatobacter sp. AB_2022a TaxID=3003134 RepID=UPI002286CF22|nr:tripartite tricarboxylate transporter substrate-binding protein [Phreatobacter sp. AB_2022a]MCZ0735769.1 tripartite tricarboxylate transporter substrate-binding protein [Phreatobacter sp. AB_2022a]